MDKAVIKECMALSFENKIAFPQVVQKLASIGVERYIADLVKLEKTNYSTGSETYIEPIPLKDGPAIPSSFDLAKVREAISTIQQGKIDYREFLCRIMKAGCSHYEVYIIGRKAIYFGRDGSLHVENFPSGK